MWGAWSVCKQLVINGGQVSGGPHSNFKLVVSGTYSWLASTGNGGVITDAQGDDFRFYSTSDCSTTALTYVRHSWADTGAVEAYVRISSLDNGTTIYIGAGDAAVTTDGSNAGATFAEEHSVHPMGSSSSISLTDLSANGYTLTNTGVAAIAGKVDGAGDFDGGVSTDVLTNSTAASSYTTMSQCAWVYADANDTTARRVWTFGASPLFDHLFLYTTGGLEFQAAWSGVNGEWRVTAPSTSAWHHVCVTYDGSSTANDPIVYVDGSSQSVTENATPSGSKNTGTGVAYHLGNSALGNRAWDGRIDLSMRINGTIWAGGLITTMYNNQNAPDTFYTISDQASSAVPRRRIIIQ